MPRGTKRASPVGGGVPWEAGEIDAFFSAFKKHGSVWRKVAQALPGRSAKDAQALYESHRGYLSLPEASPRVFKKIVADHFNNLGELRKSEQRKRPASARAGSKTPSRRGRKQLFPGGDRGARGGGQDQVDFEEDVSDFDDDDAVPVDNDDDAAAPLDTRRKRRMVASTKPGVTIPPKDEIQSRGGAILQLAEREYENNPEPFLVAERLHERLMMATTGLARRFCYYEWFYPTVDQPYLRRNDFFECLAELGFGEVTHLTRLEWGVLRQKMGRPRRFSPAFIRQERRKLHEYRRDVRSLQQGRVPKRGRDLPQLVPPKLAVGQQVIVFHPVLKELLVGSILTMDGAQYRVQFERPEVESAVVEDIHVMPLYSSQQPPNHYVVARQQPTPEEEAALGLLAVDERTPKRPKPAKLEVPPEQDFPFSPAAVAEMDLQLISKLMRLLDRKERLLFELCGMNEQAEVGIAEGTEGEFQKRYAWVVLQLHATNKALEPVFVRFRSRRASESPDPQTLSAIIASGAAAGAGAAEPVAPPADWFGRQFQVFELRARAIVRAMHARLAESGDDDLRAALAGTFPSDFQVTDPAAPAPTSEKDTLASSLIPACVALLLTMQFCDTQDIAPSDAVQLLDQAKRRIAPMSKSNRPLFDELYKIVDDFKRQFQGDQQ